MKMVKSINFVHDTIAVGIIKSPENMFLRSRDDFPRMQKKRFIFDGIAVGSTKELSEYHPQIDETQ